MDNEIIEQLNQLERRVSSLETLIRTPLALAAPVEPPSFFEAEQLILEHLPVVEEKEEIVHEPSRRSDAEPESATTDPISPSGGTDATVALAVNVTRAVASRRASTRLPRPLTRNFRPSEFGYTAEDFARDYPDVNPIDVLESFFNHHLARHTMSSNWLELFWGYAQRANSFETEKKMSNPNPTDSMGLPLDRGDRRRMLGQQ